jgi:hypothetical protein
MCRIITASGYSPGRQAPDDNHGSGEYHQPVEDLIGVLDQNITNNMPKISIGCTFYPFHVSTAGSFVP